MTEKIVLLEKTYHGFEDVYDLGRDMAELWEESMNPMAARLPGEFQGTIRVTVTYEGEDLL